MTEHSAYIGLGSNCGDRSDNIRKALSEIDKHAQITLFAKSSLYETSALGVQEQPNFINAVAQIRSSLTADELLQTMHLIEMQMGRCRNTHWGPRTIDLDLLMYDDAVIHETDICVPHSQMHLRSFVLKGLCELAPDLVHPELGRTVRELSSRLNGGDYWLNANRPQLVSITGNVGVGKSTLAARLAKWLDATFIPEKFDENPFLAEVYAGKAELALDSELFFLNSRALQLRSENLFSPHLYISDYLFDQALIYASYWLNQNDLEAYRKYYEAASKEVEVPKLIIHMQDSLENCIQRIQQRNRPYEQQIEIPYLKHLDHGYNELYADYTVCPVMRISPDECWTADQVDRTAEEVQFYIAKE